MHFAHLHCRHFKLGAVGRPVRVIGGNHVCARFRVMESGVNHARLHALGQRGAQHGFARAAVNAHPIALGNAALLRVVRMNLDNIFVMPFHIFGAPRLCAYIVLTQNATRCQNQGIFRIDFFCCRHILRHKKLALAAHKFVNMHGWRAHWIRVIARPLNAAKFVQFFKADALKGWCECGNFVHNFTRMAVAHLVTQGIRKFCRNFPIFHARFTVTMPFVIMATAILWSHHAAHWRNATLSIGKGAAFL